MNVNINGTINLLEAVRNYNQEAVVHICGSSEAYGHNTNNPTKETEPYAPLSPYALSKVCQEQAGMMYNRVYGLKTVMSRAFTHTAKRRGDVFFVSSFAKQIAKIEKGLQEPMVQVGNMESKLTIMNVRDCVEAYWLLTEKGKYGEVYNIGGKELWEVRNVLIELVKLSNKSDIKYNVDRKLWRIKDVNIQIPDVSKFKKISGWEPKISVKDTIKEVLEYWRKRIK
ncbi:hypothetical protein LCGC14_2782840, partial [marine sediment metagenome]